MKKARPVTPHAVLGMSRTAQPRGAQAAGSHPEEAAGTRNLGAVAVSRERRGPFSWDGLGRLRCCCQGAPPPAALASPAASRHRAASQGHFHWRLPSPRAPDLLVLPGRELWPGPPPWEPAARAPALAAASRLPRAARRPPCVICQTNRHLVAGPRKCQPCPPGALLLAFLAALEIFCCSRGDEFSYRKTSALYGHVWRQGSWPHTASETLFPSSGSSSAFQKLLRTSTNCSEGT